MKQFRRQLCVEQVSSRCRLGCHSPILCLWTEAVVSAMQLACPWQNGEVCGRQDQGISGTVHYIEIESLQEAALSDSDKWLLFGGSHVRVNTGPAHRQWNGLPLPCGDSERSCWAGGVVG